MRRNGRGLIKRLRRGEDGRDDAVEYALLHRPFVALACVVAITALGHSLLQTLPERDQRRLS